MTEKIKERIEQLRQLEPGWYNQYSIPPCPQLLDWLEEQENIPIPQEVFIAPVPDGGICLEWGFKGWDITLDIELRPTSSDPHRMTAFFDAGRNNNDQITRAFESVSEALNWTHKIMKIL